METDGTDPGTGQEDDGWDEPDDHHHPLRPPPWVRAVLGAADLASTEE
jgi:hypothetical protein